MWGPALLQQHSYGAGRQFPWLRKLLINRQSITKYVAWSWVEQEQLLTMALQQRYALPLWLPVQILLWVDSSGPAAEFLSQRTACTIQTSVSGGKRACTMKLCRPAACPTQSNPTAKQRGSWTTAIFCCLSTFSSSELSNSQYKEGVSSDSLPWVRFWFVDSGCETQPFCATQLPIYKAKGSAMAVQVIWNSAANWNFPLLLVLELITPCTMPWLPWNFNQWVLCVAVEMWCRYMAVVFHSSWNICCCVEIRRATSQKVQQNMLGNSIDILCQAWILRLMFPDLRASASFSACLGKNFSMVLA